MPLEPKSRLTVAIIGAGPLGRWLALSAARAGFQVLLEDVMPSNLHHALEFIRLELGPASMSANSGPPVVFVSTIEDAVRSADLVIDCVPDELESKLEILWLLDRMSPPHTVIATPTLNLSIADLASCTYRPGQCIAIAVLPSLLAGQDSGPGAAVLLKAAPATTAATIGLVSEFWRALGYDPKVDVVEN
jgi:3-hydroxybutyryl-CoA dehydrogenase